MAFHPRGRFDILCVLDESGAYIRFTSDKKRSLPREEIIAALKEYIAILEAPEAEGAKGEPR
jgi:hypothetical protein